MFRRAVATLALLLPVACGSSPESIHRQALVADLHMDTIGPVMTGRDFSSDNAHGHVDLPKLRRGEIDLMFWSIWIPPNPGDEGYYDGAMAQIDALGRLIDRYPEDLVLVTDAEGAAAAEQAGLIGCALGLEGGHMLEGSFENLQRFHDRGVRYITLTWNNSNVFATSATDESAGLAGPDPGLSERGRDLVRRMNELGILVDISHVGERTFWDALEVSEDPLIASHSGVWSRRNHPRNLKDDQIQALADEGGVVGLTYVASFVDSTYGGRRTRALEASGGAGLLTDELFDWERDRYYAVQDSLLGEELDAIRPSMSDFLLHLEQVVNLAGVEAVALGSDWDGTSLTPVGLEHAGRLPELTRALVERGYTGEQIQLMLGGNLMRVFRQVTGTDTP